ncbi:hypothetical protein Avbf_14985, partial [Armadillidium vulgare]
MDTSKEKEKNGVSDNNKLGYEKLRFGGSTLDKECEKSNEKFGRFGYNQDTLKCDFMPTGNATYFVTPRVFFFALESAVPCFLILIGYVVILMQVYSSKSFFTGNNSITSATLMSMCLRRSKTTRLIMLLLTLYLVCVIPVCIYNVVIHESELGETKNQIIGIALYCLYWIQYAANNFIYVVSNEKFRNVYRQFFSMILCRDIPSPCTAKYLRMHNDRTCRIQTIMTTRQHQKMRIRTPSEMTIDGYSTRDSLVKSQTQISILSISLNIAITREFPILLLPETHLTTICSTEKTNLGCYEKDKLSSLSQGSYFKTFKLLVGCHIWYENQTCWLSYLVRESDLLVVIFGTRIRLIGCHIWYENQTCWLSYLVREPDLLVVIFGTRTRLVGCHI